MKAVDYYKKKYGNDISKATIHLTKELGEFAGAVEKNNNELASYELVEIAGLCYFLASVYGFDMNKKLEEVYTKKLEKV